MIRLALLLVAVVILIAGGWLWLRVARVRHDPRFVLFQAHRAPDPLPDGFWPGTWAGGGTDWLGKEFDTAAGQGINVFRASPEPIKRTPFRMVVTSSVQHPKQSVLLLDYNVPGNSLRIRLVRDEVVAIAPGKLLGILYYKLGPLTLPVDYFEQQALPIE